MRLFRFCHNAGFTLPEAMIAVAITGIISAIAIPRFSSVFQKENETKTFQYQKLVQSALDKYWGEHGGQYPSNINSVVSLSPTTGGTYLAALPQAHRHPWHQPSNHVTYVSAILPLITDGSITPEEAVGQEDGGWLYIDTDIGNPEAPPVGTIVAFCTHPDVHGINWLE